MINEMFNRADLIMGLFIFLVSWIITSHHNTNYVLRYLFELKYSGISKWRENLLNVVIFIYNYTDCLRCISFWSILLITKNPLVALLFSFIGDKSGKK
jgi:hypothetical protein